jgi:hypothetical protein
MPSAHFDPLVGREGLFCIACVAKTSLATLLIWSDGLFLDTSFTCLREIHCYLLLFALKSFCFLWPSHILFELTLTDRAKIILIPT